MSLFRFLVFSWLFVPLCLAPGGQPRIRSLPLPADSPNTGTDPAAGELRLETAESKAERIVSEELGRLGWPEEELARLRKSDPEKLAIAGRLRRETTLTIRRIAARLHLGTSRSANVRLQQWMRANPQVESGRKRTFKSK